MPAAPPHPDRSFAEDVAGALAWWREAGVDQVFADEPQSWLAESGASEPDTHVDAPTIAPVAPPPPQIGGDRVHWPASLEAFASWWLSEPSLELGGAGKRIASRGPSAAEVMVLIAEPESTDAETLLSGPQGKLLEAMLSACGIARERVYLASMLPRHTPMTNWAALGEGGLGAIALHHIALAAPQRVWVFGHNILPLLGHDPVKSPADFHRIDSGGGSVTVLAAGDLATLVARPKARAAWWARWLEWSSP